PRHHRAAKCDPAPGVPGIASTEPKRSCARVQPAAWSSDIASARERNHTGGNMMKTVHSMIAAVGLAFVLPAAADAATTDPEVIIYRFPSVRDDGGGSGSGVATVFHCTNFSGTTETLRFVTREFDSGIRSNLTSNINHLRTVAVVTHDTNA